MTPFHGIYVKLVSKIDCVLCVKPKVWFAWALRHFWSMSKYTREFLVDVDNYTQLVDGFKNIVDLRRHTYER